MLGPVSPRHDTLGLPSDVGAEVAQDAQRMELPRPVPIYLTYLTVETTGNGVIFRPDPYGFDALAMPQMFGPAMQIASAA